MNQALLIFVKNLVSGKVKTRLAVTIGNDGAMLVYKQLIQHTVSITQDLPFEKIVYYSDTIENQDLWNNQIYQKQVQSGNDLGQRMQQAFAFAFRKGNQKLVIIGTDCLEINSTHIINSFHWLKTHDVVIGPARDGGYYLLAMKQMHVQLFENIQWSTEHVLKQTLTVCRALNLTVHLLPELSDIDSEEDLKKTKVPYQPQVPES